MTFSTIFQSPSNLHLNPLCHFIAQCQPNLSISDDQTIQHTSKDPDTASFFDSIALQKVHHIRISKHPLDFTGNSLENRISIESPLGKAIEGHHVGDQVEVKVNDKSSYVVEIRKIEKTGEEDSDRIRSY